MLSPSSQAPHILSFGNPDFARFPVSPIVTMWEPCLRGLVFLYLIEPKAMFKFNFIHFSISFVRRTLYISNFHCHNTPCTVSINIYLEERVVPNGCTFRVFSLERCQIMRSNVYLCRLQYELRRQPVRKLSAIPPKICVVTRWIYNSRLFFSVYKVNNMCFSLDNVNTMFNFQYFTQFHHNSLLGSNLLQSPLSLSHRGRKFKRFSNTRFYSYFIIFIKVILFIHTLYFFTACFIKNTQLS